MAVTHLRCRECRTEYPLEALYVCERCFGPLECIYDHSNIDFYSFKKSIKNRQNNIYRYSEFLPTLGYPSTKLPCGFTPLIKSDILAKRLGIKELYIKNDTINPTHSFKDRVVSIAISKAHELGFKTIACASTGNLANSVGAYSAACGIESYIYIPSNIENQKIQSTRVFNSNLKLIDDNYDKINKICTELCSEEEIGFVNINLRPYYAEGSKTIAYEIIEQLNWTMPDRIICPIASGSLFTKIGKGFKEWIDLGIIKGKIPIFNGAQAEGCSPIAKAFINDETIIPQKPKTIAKSLSIGNPADGVYAIELAKNTKGSIDYVSDKEIIDSIYLLAETTGIFAETAGGVTIATLSKLIKENNINPEEKIIAIITGDGLKSINVIE